MNVETLSTPKRTFMLRKLYEVKKQEAEEAQNSGKVKPY